MSRTGLEDAYIMRGSKKLRMDIRRVPALQQARGEQAFMLLSGKEIQEVKIHTPKGIVLNLELLDIRRSAEKVSCAVLKRRRGDPDVTDKALIYAEVTFGTEEGIVIDGGFGVGRVTKPGLDQPVGNAAINHVPRQMIRENVEEIQKKLDDFRALQVIISVPEGEELAKHTFNPRLGITGGISILGTSGIVVPMSEEALISTIRVEMEMRKAQGDRVLLVTPGNLRTGFLKNVIQWVRADHSVKCSNYVGKTLEFAAELGFDAILFVAHLGKFVKGVRRNYEYPFPRGRLPCGTSYGAGGACRGGSCTGKKTAGDWNDGRSGADFKGSRMPERDHGKSDRKNCFLHELPY